MNLLADEGVDQQVVLRLRADGHIVWYVAEMEPSISDDLVLQRAKISPRDRRQGFRRTRLSSWPRPSWRHTCAAAWTEFRCKGAHRIGCIEKPWGGDCECLFGDLAGNGAH